MHFSRIATSLAMVGSAMAWLPTEISNTERVHARDLSASQGKTLLSRDGVNLFERDAARPVKKGIRGVNLGSLFVFEPWIASDIWSGMCGSAKSEFDCVSSLGQDKANQVFQNHWKTWYTQDDFDKMAKYGLNTVRIPVGYWMDESLVDSSEHFPQGGLDALANICDMAAKSGLYIIVDHHGAAGAQVQNNPDTGQYNPNPGFYTQANYDRSSKFLAYMAQQIHKDDRFRNVGMLEVVNEPEQGQSGDQSMISQFYPQAQKAVRDAENGVSADDQLTLFYMNQKWGSGDPTSALSTTDKTAYDDHRYVKWAGGQSQTKQAYAKTSCNDDRSQAGLTTVVGEWSMSAPLDDSQAQSDDWKPSKNIEWYQGWFAAQINSYESKTDGWIYWTWKTSGLNDPRWDYSMAVNQTIIPTDFSGIPSLASSWCSKNQ